MKFIKTEKHGEIEDIGYSEQGLLDRKCRKCGGRIWIDKRDGIGCCAKCGKSYFVEMKHEPFKDSIPIGWWKEKKR